MKNSKISQDTYSLPKVAVIGRPNVGKSTLFNRMIGSREAIESEHPGTTRDSISWFVDAKIPFEILDTAGISGASGEEIEEIENNVQLQAKQAVQQADLLIFVIDAKEGITADDISVAEIIRKSSKNFIFVANKGEGKTSSDILEFASLGLGVPLVISAIHKIGLGKLLEEIKKNLKEIGFSQEDASSKKKALDLEDKKIRLSFVGRPNVGKSTLQNKFLKENRIVTSAVSGTTRDVITSDFSFADSNFVLVDTAGIRRRGKANKKFLDRLASDRSKKAIDRSDVSVLVLDGEEGVSHQDLAIANLVVESKAGFILAVNKWDLQEKGEREMKRFLNVLRARFSFATWIPVVFVSAKTGKNIQKILELAIDIYQERQKRINTSELNSFLSRAILAHKPRSSKTPAKFFYGSQVDISPPHFLFFVNNPESVHFSYRRYLENRIREQYSFNGTGIKIEIRKKT